MTSSEAKHLIQHLNSDQLEALKSKLPIEKMTSNLFSRGYDRQLCYFVEGWLDGQNPKMYDRRVPEHRNSRVRRVQ